MRRTAARRAIACAVTALLAVPAPARAEIFPIREAQHYMMKVANSIALDLGTEVFTHRFSRCRHINPVRVACDLYAEFRDGSYRCGHGISILNRHTDIVSTRVALPHCPGGQHVHWNAKSAPGPRGPGALLCPRRPCSGRAGGVQR